MKEMGNSPLVSVIIPFYQSPNLPTAIQSILAQTFQDFELILVDNNSPTEIHKKAVAFLDDSRVRITHEPCQGVVFAMNKGIQLAKGKYIARMDADDFSYPCRLEKQVEALASDTTLEVVSGLVKYEGLKQNEGFKVYVDWLNTIRTDEEIQMNQFVEFPLANPSLMFKKHIFEKYRLFEEGDFPEDYEFFLRLQQGGIKMAKVDSPVLEWRDSDDRLTRTDTRYSTDAFFKIKAKYLANWLQKNNPHHPDILVWGAGRLSRRRSDYLLEYGIRITGYIDIKRKNDAIYYEDIPNASSAFIVSYVANRGARDQIRSYLIENGYQEEKQFILAS